jgi:predicted alpha/beta-fold hydrolase
MRGTTRRLLERGVAALRVNMINCGGSEACTRLFYHAGFTLMLEISVQWAIKQGFRRIALAGFSLGGNLVLKYLGGSLTGIHRALADSRGSDSLSSNSAPPAAVIGGVAVSPPMDLALSAACIDRPRNKFYRYRFLKSMFRTLQRKQQLFPDLFPRPLEWVKTITEFDDRYTAPAGGFSSGRDYYARTSSVAWLDRIDRPTLILHARDDIYIPFTTFHDYEWTKNRNLIPLFPEHGGHLGFHASARENWMETTVAEFCRLLTEP